MTILPKTKQPPVEFTPKVRAMILERAGGRCEGCGHYVKTEAHHRLYKTRGGRGTVANGLALCGLGNTSGCHGIAHTGKKEEGRIVTGEDLGWSLPSRSDPLVMPVKLWRSDRWGIELHRWALFDNKGGVHWITDEEAARRMGTVK